MWYVQHAGHAGTSITLFYILYLMHNTHTTPRRILYHRIRYSMWTTIYDANKFWVVFHAYIRACTFCCWAAQFTKQKWKDNAFNANYFTRDLSVYDHIQENAIKARKRIKLSTEKKSVQTKNEDFYKV